MTWTTNSTTGVFNATTTTVTAGASSVQYQDTQPGNVTITASYSGDGTNSPSTKSITLPIYALVDFNHDGIVNFSDIVFFVQAYINFNQNGILNTSCDLNNDGVLNFNDVTLFIAAYIGNGQAQT